MNQDLIFPASTQSFNFRFGEVHTASGKDGKDGHTPQKGIDYFTPEDIAEIKCLKDETTGEQYELYVSNGKLMMRKMEV